jgi:uncharacterized protein YcbX
VVGVQLTALARYPVKSCRGVALESALVRPWGLTGDRRWMLIDANGEVVTAREHPRLVLVDVALDPAIDADRPTDAGGAAGLTAHTIRLRAADRPDLVVAQPVGDETVSATIWRTPVRATPADEAAHAWFSDVLAVAVRLVFLDDPASRPVDPDYSEPGDVVSFADAYPLLLTSTDSLDALNDLILTGRWADEGPLPMTRFRPNVTVKGAPPWAEDGWRRIRIGAVSFRAARPSARCVLTTVDPQTGEKGKEPLATLGRHRNWGGKLWFGMNLIPELSAPEPGAGAPVLTVGDAVEVLA